MKIKHNSEVISALKASLADPSLNDVKLFVGKEEKVFLANSYILGARSPVFKAMFFTSGLKEQQTKEVKLPQTNPQTFPSFLEYILTGEIELTAQVNLNFFLI